VTLVGRSSERARLDELLAMVRRGESSSMLLTGEAGIGKTALLDYLVDAASDFTVARAVGVESEMELAFASLHQLCAPFVDRIGGLPAPQRDALDVVFGRSAGGPPDRFLVGLAVLTLLTDLAEERPLLCVVDDAQWLDEASALALAFVARRLLAEPVGIVFAAREVGAELGQLPRLEVEGLSYDEAHTLLDAAVPSMLDESVRQRILRETRGNPLALFELPRGLTPGQLAGGFGVIQRRALARRIEESFLRRLELLSPETRKLLLLAAADPTGDPGLLWRAAERLNIAAEAADEVEAEQLLLFGEVVTFWHPLVRSAVYRAARASERRAVHLALAEATDASVDPDRRAWHLASAAPAPDEDVATELERSAARAEARGGLAAAAAFLQRAVELSADAARGRERALAAAQACLGAGAYDPASAMLTVARSGPLDDLQQGRLQILEGMAAYAERRGSDAPPLLLRAAQTLAALDPRLARETYLDAWAAALFAGDLARAGNLYEVSREVRQAPPAQPERACDVLLDGLSNMLTGDPADGTTLLQRAAREFAGGGAAADEVLRWGWLATVGVVVIWDYESCVAIAERDVQLAREHGDLTVLAVALNIYTQALAMRGDYARAEELIAEADNVTEATGTHVLQYGALYLRAFQGRALEVEQITEATVREARAGGQGTAVEFTDLARAVLLNATGRYSEAIAPAQAAADATPELVVAGWALLELIEAAARSGERERAEQALARLAERNRYVESDWGYGVEARSRALVAERSAAEPLYQEAIERLARTRLRPEHARARLLYGEWLRREHRRLDAREQLRAAHAEFASIGMEAFAERARGELEATGETVRKRAVDTRVDLTPRERNVARLAGDGLSNHEIGSRLFLSQRTVEWHLGKVFTKLGVSSRRELTEALSDEAYRG
jgi:DNA-binding CsgD family transcriptional regulator